MELTVEDFWVIGHRITGYNALEASRTQGYRKFREFFGTSPVVCLIAWDLMLRVRPRNSKPEHLLWALLLLKRYSIEAVNATLTGVTEKTFRKWSQIFIALLADLPIVSQSM